MPYRLLGPEAAVVPWDGEGLCDGDGPRLGRYPGLEAWWRAAEQLWLDHRSSPRLSLIQQVDYRRKLSNQFPVAPLRVAYSASGMHVCAAVIEDPRGVIEHNLYWAPARSVEEADFLCAILNSVVVTELVRPLMSYGKDERHIDKHVWKLAIPEFDPANKKHVQLSELGGAAGEEVAGLSLDERGHFPKLRREVRAHLASSVTGRAIEKAVRRLLGAAG